MATLGLCLGLVAGTLSPAPVTVWAAVRPANGTTPVDVDVDGDGRADLLIGSAGALQVLYGDGIRQRLTAASLRRRSYALGNTIAACDVTGDGFSDALVGLSAYNQFGAPVGAGRVVVFYGTASGLSPRRSSVLSQESRGVPGSSEVGDHFGASIGCGRMNADRFDDVVVGVPGESWRARPGGRQRLGRIVVMPGGAKGVRTARSWALNQDSPGIPDRAEDYDNFGYSLLVDDVTGDGWDELIVLASEGAEQIDVPGALFVLPGTPAGVRARGTTVIYGQTRGLPRLSGPLVSGNFDRQGPRDVILASEQRRINPIAGVTMLRGTPSGLTAKGSRTIRRNSPGMPHTPRFEANFGSTLAAGDVDGDGDDDLLVSRYFERVRGIYGAGRLIVIRGMLGGITTKGVQTFTQDTPGVPGRVHTYGAFGVCIESIDLDGDGRTEAVLSSDEKIRNINRLPSSVGAVTILPATPSGLTGRGARRLDPADFGATTREAGAGFGCDLAG